MKVAIGKTMCYDTPPPPPPPLPRLFSSHRDFKKADQYQVQKEENYLIPNKRDFDAIFDHFPLSQACVRVVNIETTYNTRGKM